MESEYKEERTLPDKEAWVRAFRNHLQRREQLKSFKLIIPKLPSVLERQTHSQLTRYLKGLKSDHYHPQKNLLLILSIFLITHEGSLKKDK